MLDYKAITARFSLEDAIRYLRLPMERQDKKSADDPVQYRSVCPSCQSKSNRALCVTVGKGFTCFAQRLPNGKFPGGDVIAFVAHVRKCPMREAAQELHDLVLTRAPAKPELARSEPDDLAQKLQKVREGLEYEHPAVTDLGLSPEHAKKLAIGFKRRGLFGGQVVLPLFVDGELVSFCGFHPERGISLPPKLSERL